MLDSGVAPRMTVTAMYTADKIQQTGPSRICIAQWRPCWMSSPRTRDACASPEPKMSESIVTSESWSSASSSRTSSLSKVEPPRPGCPTSCCVAATVSEHGSAGRDPQKVVNTYEASLNVSGRPCNGARTDRATCVSHSLVTTNIDRVNALRRYEQLRVANVPPLCEIMMTMAQQLVGRDAFDRQDWEGEVEVCRKLLPEPEAHFAARDQDVKGA
eukprot:2866690-Prymnesium_polylepis.1